MTEPLDLAAIQRRIDHGTVTRADAQALMDRVRELEVCPVCEKGGEPYCAITINAADVARELAEQVEKAAVARAVEMVKNSIQALSAPLDLSSPTPFVDDGRPKWFDREPVASNADGAIKPLSEIKPGREFRCPHCNDLLARAKPGQIPQRVSIAACVRLTMDGRMVVECPCGGDVAVSLAECRPTYPPKPLVLVAPEPSTTKPCASCHIVKPTRFVHAWDAAYSIYRATRLCDHCAERCAGA